MRLRIFVPALLLAAWLAACPLLAQEVLLSSPLHYRGFDPALPLLTVQGSGNQTGNITEFRDRTTGAAVTWMDFGGRLNAVSLSVVWLNKVCYADQMPQATAGAKIAACLAALPTTGGTVNALGLEAGTITQNMFAGVTKPFKLLFGAGPYSFTTTQILTGITGGDVFIGGLGWDITRLSWAGAAGGTMFDTKDIGNYTFADMTLDGRAVAARGILAGGGPADVFDGRFIRLEVWDFSAIGIAGYDFSLSAFGLMDASFEGIRIAYCPIGLDTNGTAWRLLGGFISEASTATVRLSNNGKVTAHGTFFSRSTVATGYAVLYNTTAAFPTAGAEFTGYGVYFENSMQGIVGTTGAGSGFPRGFRLFGAQLHTNSAASLIDVTGWVAGQVELIGCFVPATSASATILLPAPVIARLIQNDGIQLAVVGAGTIYRWRNDVFDTGAATYFGLSTSAGYSLVLRAAANSARDFTFATALTPRWRWRTDATAEAGANSGSDFSLIRYDDAGGVLGSPLFIARANGLMYYAGAGVILNNGTAITKHLSATASLDFTALAANTCETLTIAVVGAADGNTVTLGVPTALADVDGATERTTFFGWVSAADVVSVRRCNPTLAATVDPAAATVRADVWQH